jgi:hypothetical protein
VLTVRLGHDPIEALPSGPLEVEHRTLEVGLRAWVERQMSERVCRTALHFGDRDRVEDARAGRALTVAYLAHVREARPGGEAPERVLRRPQTLPGTFWYYASVSEPGWPADLSRTANVHKTRHSRTYMLGQRDGIKYG